MCQIQTNGIGTAFVGADFLLAGTAAAPFVAVGALAYGVMELGSYIFTEKSIEDHIFRTPSTRGSATPIKP